MGRIQLVINERDLFMKKTIFFLFFLESFLFSSEFIDIGCAINQRTQQYLTGDYKNIYVVSPPRTGSTYIYNILRYLFENDKTKMKSFWGNEYNVHKVAKLHNFIEQDQENAIIIPIRDPLYAIFSLYRISNEKSLINDDEINEEIIEGLVKNYTDFLYQYAFILSNTDEYLLIRYENFFNKMSYVIKKLEEFFSIKIHEKDKFFLEKILSRNNVLANIEKYQTFEKYDPLSGFHGNHIQTIKHPEKEGRIFRVIFEHLEKHREIIEIWGYSLTTP